METQKNGGNQIMKCQECDYYNGMDWETGEQRCSLDGECIYTNKTDRFEHEIKISIDIDDMQRRIENAFASSINKRVDEFLHNMVKERYEALIEEKMPEKVDELLEQKMAEFMEEPIHIGGGWDEPDRTLTRNAYITELINKRLDKCFNAQKISDEVAKSVDSKIRSFAKSAQQEANRKIDSIFTSAMKTNITDSIVNVLMDNETYRKLSDNVQHLIEGSSN